MEYSGSYIPLADDLTKIIEGYQNNPLITEHQREIWDPQGKKKAIIHGMLGEDHPEALKLLEADGYDGQPVGSLSTRSAESFWNYKDNHIFPPQVDLIRFGIFFHLAFYRILALVLKGIWEKFFAREICEWRTNLGKELSDILQRADKMNEALSRFNPDTDELFYLFLDHGNLDPDRTEDSLVDEAHQDIETINSLVEKMNEEMLQSGVRWLIKARYTTVTFDTLVQEMLHNRINWVATDSHELDRFIEEKLEEVVIWNLGTEDDRQKYWRLTQARIQLLMDLDEVYLDIESTRLQNEKINYKYLNIFGEYEIALKEAKIRYSMLDKKVMLKRQNRDLTEVELNEQVQKMIEEEGKKLDEEREKAKWASLIEGKEVRIPGEGQPLGDDGRKAYITKCKKILRKIHLLIHPDRLQNNSDYEDLTSKQKEELKEILKKTLEIKPEEPIYPDSFIENHYRSPQVLQSILDRVKFILENAGIDIDPGVEIQGETLPERLTWLEENVKLQEKYLRTAKAQLQALMTNEDILQKKEILKNEQQHQEIINEMVEKTEEYTKKAEKLEAELEKLMEDVPT